MLRWRSEWRWRDGHVVRDGFGFWKLVRWRVDWQRVDNLDLERASARDTNREPVLSRRSEWRRQDGYVVRDGFGFWKLVRWRVDRQRVDNLDLERASAQYAGSQSMSVG